MCHTVGSFFSLMWYTVLFMKMASYSQVNWWCRTDQLTKKRGVAYLVSRTEQTAPCTDILHAMFLGVGLSKGKLVQYPDNLNLKGEY